MVNHTHREEEMNSWSTRTNSSARMDALHCSWECTPLTVVSRCRCRPVPSNAIRSACVCLSMCVCSESMESIAQRTTDVYEQLLRREIPNRDAEFNCGRSYLEAERAELAEEVFRRLLEAGYKSQDSRFRLAESLFAQCRYVEAKKELLKLLQDEPDHADALEFLAEFQRHVNRGANNNGRAEPGQGRA